MSRTIQEIWKDVPEVHCKGLCTEACGPVLMSTAEVENLKEKGLRVPWPMPNFTCDQLKNGRCEIYENRPLICRLWGAVKAMRCPHGCVPDKGFLKESTARKLLDEMERI